MMRKSVDWENWVNLLLGAWLFVIPWTVSHSVSDPNMASTMWNFWIAGAAVFVVAALALQELEPIEEWTNLTAGIWMIAAPWLLGYTRESGLLWNSVVVGLIVTTLSAKSLLIALQMQKKQFNAF